MKDIAVIISIYSIDRADDVANCIRSIKNQSYPPKEIIIVLDPNEALINYYKPRLDRDLTVVVSDAYGLSSARNTGIKNTCCELVAFIDDDAIADADWLYNLTQALEDPSVIGAGGRIIPVWPNEQSWFPEELYWIVGCSYKGLSTKKTTIRNPIGCNMIFRRSAFEVAGYFNTGVGRVGNKLLGHDDTEFGIRVTSKLRGSKIVYVPQAVVYHKISPERVSLKYILKRSYAEGFSKAFVTYNYRAIKSTLDTENIYLKNVFLGIPSLLFDEGMRKGLSKFIILFISTMFVFLGYAVGFFLFDIKRLVQSTALKKHVCR